MDLNENYRESIEYFEQNNQVNQDLSVLWNQDSNNETISQIKREIDSFLSVQEKEIEQTVNIGQSINDEEEEYIKANKIYDQSQLQKQQKQIENDQTKNDQLPIAQSQA